MIFFENQKIFAIFAHNARPFYQSVTIMNLKPLEIGKYIRFANEKFEEGNRHFDPAVLENLYDRFDGVTSYIHRVLNILYSRTGDGQICTVDMVEPAIDFIVRMSSDTYESLFYQMPQKQRDVFLAIASENKATEVTGGLFVKKHSLVSASSVSSALKGLLDKDFITNDNSVYSIYDKFFQIWLSKRGLI